MKKYLKISTNYTNTIHISEKILTQNSIVIAKK